MYDSLLVALVFAVPLIVILLVQLSYEKPSDDDDDQHDKQS